MSNDKAKKFILRKKEVKIPMKEFVEEHKRLLSVLRSPSHKDDAVEADKQQKELKQETKKAEYSTETVDCGTGLAGKICEHNQSRVNKFAKDKKAKKALEKSVDFQNTKSSVETDDQLLAEKTASKELIDYISTMVQNNPVLAIAKIPLEKGMLTLSEKEPGLYNGFFQDKEGQIVEKFDNQTVAGVAKHLQLKNWYSPPKESEIPVPSAPDKQDEQEDKVLAQTEALKLLAQHNELYHKGQLPGQPISGKGGYIRIKAGDFELELKKSVRAFVNDFKLEKSLKPELLKKALKSWRKQYHHIKPLANDQAAAKEILANWEYHQEELAQIVSGLISMENFPNE